jgi:hypothetical protein
MTTPDGAHAPSSWRVAASFLVALCLLTAHVTAPPPAFAATELEILALSNRADLISAGDALVEVVLPDGSDARDLEVDADGRDVSGAFALRGPGPMEGPVVGLVDGLELGANVLTARLPDGRGARITITNRPRGGPIFAGPQVQPWVCSTEQSGLGPAQDEQCNAPTIFEFSYKSSTTRRFEDYDPDNPPASSAIATTTTDDGETVPYIVRVERGTLDRGIYELAVLYDPSQPWEPWAPQRGWNGKLSFLFGSACNPGHEQGGAVDARNDMMLSQGFAVGTSSANVFGNVCNLNVAAESLMMIQERRLPAVQSLLQPDLAAAVGRRDRPGRGTRREPERVDLPGAGGVRGCGVGSDHGLRAARGADLRPGDEP